KRLLYRGPLADHLPEAAKLRLVPSKLAEIETHQSTGKHMEGALSFLADALRCIGVEKAPKLDLSFAGSSELVFKFSGVTAQTVDPTKLDQIIQGLTTEGIPEEDVEEGKLHIAYEYAYAKSLLIVWQEASDASVDLAGKLGEYFDLGTSGR